jgi:hypothetical protein
VEAPMSDKNVRRVSMTAIMNSDRGTGKPHFMTTR